MSLALPFRSRVRNTARATAAPAAIHLLATRPTGPDSCETLIAGDYQGALDNARRHAVHVLHGLAQRYPGCDVQLWSEGVLLFVVTDNAGGAS